jgi:hypothetical protein
MVKSKLDPQPQPFNDPSEEANVNVDIRKKEEKHFGRLEEFNADM